MSKQKHHMDLLAAIKRQPTDSEPAKTEDLLPSNIERGEPVKSQKVRVAKPLQKTNPVGSRKGGPVQFWMHDDDRKLVRELAAWLAGQGLRTTDSLVIRAALRQAKTGGGLIDAYWEAAKLDGRLKKS